VGTNPWHFKDLTSVLEASSEIKAVRRNSRIAPNNLDPTLPQIIQSAIQQAASKTLPSVVRLSRHPSQTHG
jgi:hypothetical protein